MSWGLNKMTEMTFSNAFSSINIIMFWFKFELSFEGFSWQKVSICCRDGLVMNRQHAITWTNHDPVHWCIWVNIDFIMAVTILSKMIEEWWVFWSLYMCWSHHGLMMTHGVIDLGQHWLRLQLVINIKPLPCTQFRLPSIVSRWVSHMLLAAYHKLVGEYN